MEEKCLCEDPNIERRGFWIDRDDNTINFGSEGNYSDCYVSGLVEIKYCPFCGKKFIL